MPNASGYGYDNNGNVISDNGKHLDIAYNIINLPRFVTSTENSDFLKYSYAIGGEKIKKVSSTNGVIEERLYLGNLEVVDGELKFINHHDGRVKITSGRLAYQFKLNDHLGNNVVYFQDKDDDGEISTDVPPNPSDVEVLQRNYYYPFGMGMNGAWNGLNTETDQNYLYNGKERDSDLGLNWDHYGFRMYDASIGRFTGVDPIADQFAHVSTYNYAENSPIGNIDLWGLQAIDNNNIDLHHDKWSRRKEQFLFGAKHPIIFLNVGMTNAKYSINISSNALRITSHLKKAMGFPSSGIGSPKNAVKHVLWQAKITNDFGKETATEIGNAHEGLGASATVALNPETFIGNKKQADRAVDLLNNEIGKHLGAGEESKSIKDLAYDVLDVYYTDGLWQSTKNANGQYTISRQKISEDQYNSGRAALDQLNENGQNEKQYNEWIESLQEQ